ncbi:hypothetical protein CAOG_07712 [Capsaspora owczarzaki ATCC 30864]|uniref:Uncharacterized protein n=1 Tax=Capsaspora owczarzaki (strain ATCC 30864) TaxID=595528 RepID=A0A0D2UQJ0_CAPO3|nr:hypothetical protein CAOG_07712 [Capsaspora owczarzaki ATCC 30864]KJE97276.1 hypothetical protein CAOG_007712 [Capsaspora owczarzaki ATCC 30864]|eukprot:XP_004343586.1 hypothetical protein CAOG_07712 [Capsaspora owczarzaki ATCC 30864]
MGAQASKSFEEAEGDSSQTRANGSKPIQTARVHDLHLTPVRNALPAYLDPRSPQNRIDHGAMAPRTPLAGKVFMERTHNASPSIRMPKRHPRVSELSGHAPYQAAHKKARTSGVPETEIAFDPRSPSRISRTPLRSTAAPTFDPRSPRMVARTPLAHQQQQKHYSAMMQTAAMVPQQILVLEEPLDSSFAAPAQDEPWEDVEESEEDENATPAQEVASDDSNKAFHGAFTSQTSIKYASGAHRRLLMPSERNSSRNPFPSPMRMNSLPGFNTPILRKQMLVRQAQRRVTPVSVVLSEDTAQEDSDAEWQDVPASEAVETPATELGNSLNESMLVMVDASSPSRQISGAFSTPMDTTTGMDLATTVDDLSGDEEEQDDDNMPSPISKPSKRKSSLDAFDIHAELDAAVSAMKKQELSRPVSVDLTLTEKPNKRKSALALPMLADMSVMQARAPTRFSTPQLSPARKRASAGPQWQANSAARQPLGLATQNQTAGGLFGAVVNTKHMRTPPSKRQSQLFTGVKAGAENAFSFSPAQKRLFSSVAPSPLRDSGYGGSMEASSVM